MSTDTAPSQLTPRDREVLKDVIATFLGTGEPVSSRRVAKLRRHGLSAATIRNVMADLEELGLLSQPHTSAGRVPTESGYHMYIDSLMPSRHVPAELRRQIDDGLATRGGEELMSSASHLLSELSHQIGIVMVPALGETVLRAVSFVRLSGDKVLCVLVSAGGFVDSKVIEASRTLAREELVRISNYLTDNFGGQTLRQIRDRLLKLMAEERAQVDRLLASTIELARQALAVGDAPDLLVEGTSSVLNRPELADVDRVRRLLDTFADKARLVQLLNRMIEGRGVRVVIGQDSDLTSDLDFSLVATTYGPGEQAIGSLGIFGPSRMDYPVVIPLVNYLGDRLSRALEQTLADSP